MKEEKLVEGAVYIIKNGKPKIIEPPNTGFGKQTIHWQDGKPIMCEVSYTTFTTK